MKDRTPLRLIPKRHKRPVTVTSIARGEWRVHASATDKYVVSHCSGLALVRGVGAATAAHMLRRLQDAPPIPFASVVVVGFAQWREAVEACVCVAKSAT